MSKKLSREVLEAAAGALMKVDDRETKRREKGKGELTYGERVTPIIRAVDRVRKSRKKKHS